MLQLPSPVTIRKFSKAEIAEIARGAKPAKRSRPATPDSVITLITRADAALSEYIEAKNAKYVIQETMEVRDTFRPFVELPDAMLQLYWSRGTHFTSLDNIDLQFTTATRFLKRQAREYRAAIRKLSKTKGQNVAQIEYERRQMLASCEYKLSQLPLHLDPLKKAYEKERRRVLSVQRRSGYSKVSQRCISATRELADATRSMNTAKPVTISGALALIAYVQDRLGKPALFCDDGYFPSNLSTLLRRARTVIKRAVPND